MAWRGTRSMTARSRRLRPQGRCCSATRKLILGLLEVQLARKHRQLKEQHQ